MAEKFADVVDSINEWTGRAGAWLFVPFILLTIIDVFTRYVLNNPWYYLDINKLFLGALAAVGAGYCYLYKGHVSVDILVSHLSARKQAIVEAAIFPLVLGALGPLLWKVTQDTINAVNIKAGMASSAIYIPVWLMKCVVTMGITLMLLQGIAFFIRNLKVIFPARSGGKP